jgi:hypothetical protein
VPQPRPPLARFPRDLRVDAAFADVYARLPAESVTQTTVLTLIEAHAPVGSYLPLTGGELTGPLVVPQLQVNALSGVLKAAGGVVVGGAAHADLGSIGVNDHHNRAHVLTDGDHTEAGLTPGHVLTASGATTFGWAALPAGMVVHAVVGEWHSAAGLTAGQVLRASAETTFAWAQLQHADLGDVSADQHHAQGHALTAGPHTESGLTPGNVLTASGAAAFGWAALPASVAPGRLINTTSPLTGGGDLSADRTLSLGYTANLRVTSGNLDTVQDIQTASSPQFAAIGVGGVRGLGLVDAFDASVPFAGTLCGSANGPVFTGRQARGTSGSPTATQSNDLLAEFGGRGRGTDIWAVANAGAVRIYADETWTNTANGSRIEMWTTPRGSTTPARSLQITQNGTFYQSISISSVGIEWGFVQNVTYALSGNTNQMQGSFMGRPTLNQNGYNSTGAVGVVGVVGNVTVSGSAGTVTGAAGLYAVVGMTGNGPCTNGYGLYVATAGYGGTQFTNVYGIDIQNQFAGVNQYGISSRLASGANKWNLYISGTAINYLAGNLLLGTTTDGMTAAGSIAIAKDLAHRGTKAGFYNITPVTRPTAYTQTYATASKTVPAATASNPPAGGTGATEGAYDTAVNRDAMITSLTNNIADVLALKKVVNALIDDLQALGLVS